MTCFDVANVATALLSPPNDLLKLKLLYIHFTRETAVYIKQLVRLRFPPRKMQISSQQEKTSTWAFKNRERGSKDFVSRHLQYDTCILNDAARVETGVY